MVSANFYGKLMDDGSILAEADLGGGGEKKLQKEGTQFLYLKYHGLKQPFFWLIEVLC